MNDTAKSNQRNVNTEKVSESADKPNEQKPTSQEAQQPKLGDGILVLNEAQQPKIGDRIMVLNEPWLALVLHKVKTQEIRRGPAAVGPTWLAYNGIIYGSATVSDCSPMTEEEFIANRQNHQHLEERAPYAKLFALTLENIVKLPEPVPHYRPPQKSAWATFRTGAGDRVPQRSEKKRKTASETKPAEAPDKDENPVN